MEDGRTLYILDPKFYRFGMTRKPEHLPTTDSVQKRLTYAQSDWKSRGEDYQTVHVLLIDPRGLTRCWSRSEKKRCSEYLIRTIAEHARRSRCL